MLLIGGPGCGKSMICSRLPSIMPDMTPDEIIETTKIYSIVHALSREEPVMDHRPFRSPHHTVSAIALCGGGSVPRPGEVSLAHNGILYLDELPQLINVLRGEMSLVGPRPERACFYRLFDEAIEGFHNRLCVQPGLTGWAQVHGSMLLPQEKIVYDMEYINRRCLRMDIRCLAMTVKTLLCGDET